MNTLTIEFAHAEEIDWTSYDFFKDYFKHSYHNLSNKQNSDQVTIKYLRNLSLWHTKKDHYLLLAKKKQSIVGVCFFLLSEWDSRLFGFPYGSIKHMIAQGDYSTSLAIKQQLIRTVLSWAKKNNVTFFHYRVQGIELSSIHALERHRFNLISPVGQFFLLSKKITPIKKSPYVRHYTENDREEIKNISKFIFLDNRFFLDKRFSREMVQRLYSKWVENMCKGQMANKVLIYRHPHKKCIAGFVTCGVRKKESELFEKRIGSVDLIGIDSKFSNSGIGVKLLNGAVEWLQDNTDLTVAIMALQNRTVIRTAGKFGFYLQKVLLDFHWWNEKQ